MAVLDNSRSGHTRLSPNLKTMFVIARSPCLLCRVQNTAQGSQGWMFDDVTFNYTLNDKDFPGHDGTNGGKLAQ